MNKLDKTMFSESVVARRVTHLKLHFECPCCSKAIWVDFETKPDDVATTVPIKFIPDKVTPTAEIHDFTPPKVESTWGTPAKQPSYTRLEAACRAALTAIRDNDLYTAAAILRDVITPELDQ